MPQSTELVRALNTLTKSPQFNYSKARAAARAAGNVDWAKTKSHNDDFNPEVDGCESFVMSDGSVCEWIAARQMYTAR
ncbi:MAG: hypothetical protein NVSMB64_30400 [Candidatus Velthaea sp.]